MNLDEFKTLITGELVCRLGLLYRVKWTSADTISLVDEPTETHQRYLRFSNPETAGWIRQLYRSTKNRNPRPRLGYVCIVQTQLIEVHTPRSVEALYIAEKYADEHFPGAVITGRYQRSRDGKHVVWRIHLAQIHSIPGEPAYAEPDYAPDWALGQE